LKVFVTGATGFIGGNLVRALLARGHAVRCLVRNGSNLKNVQGLEVELVRGDLRDDSLDLSVSLRGCEALFHAAAVYSFWTPDAPAVIGSNVQGTKNVLAAAVRAGVSKVVYTSTESTIGVLEGCLGTEESVIDEGQLHGQYKLSKHRAERVALDMWREYRVPVVVVNPTMPIGAFDVKPTPTGQVIVDFLNHRMPAYVDTGINLVDVEDVAAGHVLAMERGKPGDRYILGNRNATFREMLGILESVTGIRAPRSKLPMWVALGAACADELVEGRVLRRCPRVQFAAVRAAGKHRYHDCSKAVRELGMPQSPVEKAFTRAVDWFRLNGYAN
jgi:dihydroflavonol-4-reductase